MIKRRRRERAAEPAGCTFIQAHLPEGWRHWVEGHWAPAIARRQWAEYE